MGSQASPDPPDYRGAAEQTAAGNLAMLQQQTYANRPTRTTPWGQETWTPTTGTDPTTGDPITQWGQQTTLDPQLQQSLEAQLGLQTGRAELGAGMFGRMEEEYGQPMDWEQYGDPTGLEYDPSQIRGQAEEALYGRATGRLDPQFEQREQQQEIQLRNRGLRPGDEAYDTAVANLGRERTQAYTRAEQEATIGGRAEAGQLFSQQQQQAEYANKLRQQQMQEDLTRRGFSLNEINAIIKGQQVGMPQFTAFNQAGRTAGPDYTGAAQAQYAGDLNQFSADQAQQQMMMSGLGSAAGMAGMFLGG